MIQSLTKPVLAFSLGVDSKRCRFSPLLFLACENVSLLKYSLDFDVSIFSVAGLGSLASAKAGSVDLPGAGLFLR